uniref:PDZ domain-containing protein n=1 Tax=Panagrolaimus davidi TaxID=227884 RepID=A0A914QMS4_9BILA
MTRRYILSAPGCSSNLPKEVYQKIHQVDQEPSTLTNKGITGFSARILSREEKRRGNEIVIVQLVEIIKKPGQSLGLYLREGNGRDRFTGVFASRFGENSDLENNPDKILLPGDEILTVNNVDVSQMSIDDVVLILSIPKRLLLRICFPKNRPESHQRGGGGVGMPDRERPIVVVHKRDDTRGGVMDNSGGLLSRPPTTASTWLGKRVRQQKQDMLYGSMQRMSAPSISDPYGGPSTSSHRYPQDDVPKPVGMTSPRQQYAPRLLDSQGKQILNDPGSIASTAIVPPPKMMRPKQPPYSSQTLGRLPSHSNDPFRRPLRPSLVQVDPLSARSSRPSPYSNPTAPIYPDQYSANTSSAATAIGLPSTSSTATYMPNITSSYKSNSLPRRRVQSGAIGTLPRTVKWRNDVVDSQTRGTMSDVEDFTYINHPDSTGISADSLRNRLSGLSLSARGPNTNKTIADIFSAQEYRNWAGADSRYFPNAMDQRRSRWSDPRFAMGANSVRSSSLPPKAMLSTVSFNY